MSTYWNNRIAVEEIGGVPFRMYTERPHRLDELLAFADHWANRICLIQGERTVTFAALRRAIDAKGKWLRGGGLARGAPGAWGCARPAAPAASMFLSLAGMARTGLSITGVACVLVPFPC
jgi:hypothetical protein